MLYEIKRTVKESKTYDEWKFHVSEFDEKSGNNNWKEKKECNLYDWERIEKFTLKLKNKRENKDIKGLVYFIRSNLTKNFCGILHPSLYRHSFIGTKKLIIEYYEELINCLDYICNFNEAYFPLTKKIEFFSESKHSFGRTALLLSGK